MQFLSTAHTLLWRALPATLLVASAAAQAIGSLADINVVDRNTGQVLPVYTHQGRHYVAGTPGARYAVRVYNKTGARVMAVMAVDGVNVVSGETAAWDQNGYVLSSWQRHDVAGWRKSQAQVAAFEFTALANSYAARTGRPDNVGVIGVALFRERPVPVSVPAPVLRREDAAGRMADSRTDARAEASSAAPASAPTAQKRAMGAADSAANEAGAMSRPAPAQPEKLGTGHGARENAWVNYTSFERAQPHPDEVITIYYDSRDNLVAQGVIAAPRPLPRPFPVQPQVGFVPDPPRL